MANTVLRCTWCNKEFDPYGTYVVNKTDPFCSQECLDLQLHDDKLFEQQEAERVKHEEEA